MGGWPTQAWVWLEWGSSTGGQSLPAARSRRRAVHSDLISTRPMISSDIQSRSGEIVVSLLSKVLRLANQAPRDSLLERFQRIGQRISPPKPTPGLSGPPARLRKNLRRESTWSICLVRTYRGIIRRSRTRECNGWRSRYWRFDVDAVVLRHSSSCFSRKGATA